MGGLVAWLALIGLSGVATILLEVPRFPAALLLGPMAAAMGLALAGRQLTVHSLLVAAAQGDRRADDRRQLSGRVLARAGGALVGGANRDFSDRCDFNRAGAGPDPLETFPRHDGDLGVYRGGGQ